MIKISDKIKSLKKLEHSTIQEIDHFIYQNYLSNTGQADGDSLYQNKYEHEKYLFTCLSRFIKYIEAQDHSFYNTSGSSSCKTGEGIWVEPDQTKLDDYNELPNLIDWINPDRKECADDIIHFKYIASMLDLNNNHVCKLLPYLLAAYVCMFARSRLFSRGSTALFEIFRDLERDGDQTADQRDARRKVQIARLSKCFSFEGHPPTYKYHNRHERKPTPYLVDRKRPYHDALFAEHVFEAFAVIVFDVAKEMGKEDQIQNVISKVDLVSCYLLLLSYLKPDEIDNISNERVTKHWNNPKYGKRFLKAFRSHYETHKF